MSKLKFNFQYPSHDQYKNAMGGACSTMEERRGAYRFLAGKPDGRRPLGRPRRRWEDNIKMDIQVLRWGHGLADLAQDWDGWWAFVNTVTNLQLP
jgi:hypothetical protein